MLIGIDEIKIPDNAGYKHTATSWQVSKTLDFKDNLILNIDKDTTNLLEYNLDYTLNSDEIIYVRVKVHFDNDTETNWSKIISIDSCQRGLKFSNTIIVTPTITTNFTNNDYPLGGFNIKSSPFMLYSGTGSHNATSWYIKDIDNNVVWQRLKDTENLYEIRVPDNILKDNKGYVIMCQHHTDTNSVSNYGKLHMATGSISNLLIKVHDIKLISSIDRCYIDLSVNTKLYDSILIEIRDRNNQVVGTYGGDTDIIVECDNKILSGEKYTVNISLKYSDSKYSTLTTEVVYADTPYIKLCDSFKHVYNNDIKTLGSSNIGDIVHISEELPGGLIPIFRVDRDQVSLFRYNGTYNLIEVGLGNIILPNSKNHIIKSLPNNKVVVSYKQDDVYKFSVYEYNILTNKFTFLKTVVRDNDKVDINHLNNLTVINNNEIVYLADFKLKKFNVDTYSLTTLYDPQHSGMSDSNIIYICEDELLVMLGSDGTTINGDIIYKYNIAENTWTELGNLPDDFPKDIYNMSTFMRDDGMVVFFNATTKDDKFKNQGYILYNPREIDLTKAFSKSDYTTEINLPILSTIKLLDGSYIRFNKELVLHYT